MASPVIAASGTAGYGPELGEALDVKLLGGIVTKGISLTPQEGNRPPRIAETPCGMLNSIGLENVGLRRFVEEILPRLKALDTNVVVNLYGTTPEEFARLAEAVEAAGKGVVKAVELNLSCPNVAKGGMAFGQDPEAVREATAAVRAATSLQVWVKLTPNVSSPVPMARAAAEAGADAVCLINTLLGMAIDARTRGPRLGAVVGGLSGPAIKPVGLRMVWEVAREVEVDVIGIGGIITGEDVVEYMLAGARAVQVGTASLREPGACGRIVQELAAFCAEEGVESVDELVGALQA